MVCAQSENAVVSRGQLEKHGDSSCSCTGAEKTSTGKPLQNDFMGNHIGLDLPPLW